MHQMLHNAPPDLFLYIVGKSSKNTSLAYIWMLLKYFRLPMHCDDSIQISLLNNQYAGTENIHKPVCNLNIPSEYLQ